MAVGVKDVAAAASVSVGTVSNVLNNPDKVAPATVARVQKAIAELGFVRNDAARQLRAGRSRSIGLVVLDVGNPFFADVARGAEARAAEAGLAVLFGSSDERADREGAYVDLFREQRVNGVLVTPATADLSSLVRLQDAGIPVVLVDREADDDALASVAVDDVEGGYLATRHLIDAGRRRITFVGGPLSTRQVHDRLEGARRAVAEHPDVALDVMEMPALTVLQGREAGNLLRARDAASRPDGVFAANDLLAVGVLQSFALLGEIRVPEDIALIGYDDIDFAAATVVPLSSIRQPAREIGATAVDLLLAEIARAGAGGEHGPGGGPGPDAGERRIRFRPELIVRASTGG